jgi:hypothetical protein
MTHTDELASALAALIADYASNGNIAAFRRSLEGLAARTSPDALAAAAAPWRDEPELMAAMYEHVVAAQPENARALILLANAYWLLGRGPIVVGELASRAIAADPAQRGGWHLWALSESDPRHRVQRWQQVADRFPDDDLALAAVADNAAAVAGAERDYAMLDLSIETFERLRDRASEPAQRDAVDGALRKLRAWRF